MGGASHLDHPTAKFIRIYPTAYAKDEAFLLKDSFVKVIKH